jgi:hypothetical protein
MTLFATESCVLNSADRFSNECAQRKRMWTAGYASLCCVHGAQEEDRLLVKHEKVGMRFTPVRPRHVLSRRLRTQRNVRVLVPSRASEALHCENVARVPLLKL